MASKKISELTASGALTGAELVEAVQGGQNVKTTTQAIADLGGGGGGGTWGSITGTLSAQTDLDTALDAIDTSISNHISDATAAHAGTAISNTPAGSIAATTVQAAINELDADVNLKFDYLVTLRTETASDILDSTDLANVNAGDHLVRQQNVATANDLEIPLNATVAFPVGTTICVRNIGAGVVTITGAIGVTLASPLSLFNLTNQYDTAYIEKVATNTWYVNGELS